MTSPTRLMLVQDVNGNWFIRKVAYSTFDGAQYMMVYHCDKPLAGPFADLADACVVLEAAHIGYENPLHPTKETDHGHQYPHPEGSGARRD